MRHLIFIFTLLLLSSLGVSSSAGEGAKAAGGSVCLGPNLSVVLNDRDHVTISVGDISGITFSKDNSARLVADGLDLAKVYPVVVYYDGDRVESWKLDFEKLGGRMALIWRAKGGYRMRAAPGGKCEWASR